MTRLINCRNQGFGELEQLSEAKKLACEGKSGFTTYLDKNGQLFEDDSAGLKLLLHILFVGFPSQIEFDVFSVYALGMIIDNKIEYTFQDYVDFDFFKDYYNWFEKDINKGLYALVDKDILSEEIFCYTAENIRRMDFYNLNNILRFFKDIFLTKQNSLSSWYL